MEVMTGHPGGMSHRDEVGDWSSQGWGRVMTHEPASALQIKVSGTECQPYMAEAETLSSSRAAY